MTVASDEAELRRTLSEPRFGTYLTACAGDAAAALELYGWNARISAALLLPAHFAEISTRNAVAEVLTIVYGQEWPWSKGFTQSLPAPATGYSSRRDLQQTRMQKTSTGKVIAELKFIFWQTMFTSRHDDRLWTPYIHQAFPQHEMTPPPVLRAKVYDGLSAIRQVRNRIAHHEPIFTFPLSDLVAQIDELVGLRSAATVTWMSKLHDAGAVLLERP